LIESTKTITNQTILDFPEKYTNYTCCVLNSETMFCNRTRGKFGHIPKIIPEKVKNLNDTLFNRAVDAVFNSTDNGNAETENYTQRSCKLPHMPFKYIHT